MRGALRPDHATHDLVIREGAPLNGFDTAARDAYLNGVRRVKQAIIDAEVRDGVMGMFDEHTPLLTDGTPQYKHGQHLYNGDIGSPRLTMYLGKPAYRIVINTLPSVRITNDPISFLANKSDHYIPDDCPVTFINLQRNL